MSVVRGSVVGESVAGWERGWTMRTVVTWPFSKLSRRPYMVSRWSIWDQVYWAAAAGKSLVMSGIWEWIR